MNKLIIIFALILLSSSCYNYDGPIRTKRTLPTPKPYVVPVKKTLSAQAYLENMAAEIAKAIPSAEVEVLADSIKVLFPDDIQYNESSVLPINNISPEIKKLAGLINKYDKTHVLITGHSNPGGEEQLNKKLSELRAQYIESLLHSYNVPSSRLNSWGLGSKVPKLNKKNDSDDRRVEFIVLATIDDDEDS